MNRACATALFLALSSGPIGAGSPPGGRAQADCTASGGEWQQVGILAFGCVRRMPDVGAVCTDSSNCQGKCLVTAQVDTGVAVEGRCSEFDIVVGCHATVEEGRSGAEICAD